MRRVSYPARRGAATAFKEASIRSSVEQVKRPAAQPQSTDVQVSVVVPIFNEVENVRALVDAITTNLEELGRTFEVILVDDGSTDGTAEELRAAAAARPQVQAVTLARNYGQSTAMQAGFDHARGELVVTLDGDLQNDARDIHRLIKELERNDLDVVSGWRKRRDDPPVRKMFSRVANRIISYLTRVPVHDFGCTLKVYRRAMLSEIRLYGEMHRFLPALLTEVGARVGEIEVTHHPRKHGRSKYTLGRTFKVVLDLLLVIFLRKYLQRPLHAFGSVGLLCLVPGGLILTYLALIKVFAGVELADRPLLTLGVLMVLVGVILLGQGLLGEVTVRTLYRTGAQAQYLVRAPRGRPLQRE